MAPAELEGHLLMHPDVADACVVSVPNEYSGELPMAYIVIRDKALQRIAGDKTAALRLKAVLAKVTAFCHFVELSLTNTNCPARRRGKSTI